MRPPGPLGRLSGGYSRSGSCRVFPFAAFKRLLRLKHRFGDALVGAAAADISAHQLAYAFRVVSRMTFRDETDRAHDLARRTETALESVMRNEGSLNRVQHVSQGNSLDRGDGRDIEACSKRKA